MSRKVHRVPLELDFQMGAPWPGCLMPDELVPPPCPDCVYADEPDPLFGNPPEPTGYSAAGWLVAGSFYPHMVQELFPGTDRAKAERVAWHDKITADEVDMLVAEHRLHQWNLHDVVKLHLPYREGERPRYDRVRNDRPAPTVEEVNAAERERHVHDGLNRMLLIRHRLRRLGIDYRCPACRGKCHLGTPEQVSAYDAWEPTGPPAGDGWQLWETVTEGSPVTPVFGSAEALAHWLATRGEWRRSLGDYADPYRLAAAEALVRNGPGPGTGYAMGGVLVDSARDVDTWELEEMLDN